MAKKIIAWLLVVVLTAGAAIGGTLAYLTDRDSEANVFTVGDVKIDLEEDFDQGAELIPGVDVEKKPTITNVGINDAWVWATVAVPEKLASVIEFTGKGEGWAEWTEAAESVEIEGKRYTLYTALYNEALSTGDVTTALFDTVTLDKTVDIDPDGQWHAVVGGTATDLGWNNSDGNPVIYVSAYAIQTEGFESVEDAYTAYNIQWGETGEEYAKLPKMIYTAEELKNALKDTVSVILGADIVFDSTEDYYLPTYGCGVNVGSTDADREVATVYMNGHSIDFTTSVVSNNTTVFVVRPTTTLNIIGEGEIRIDGDHIAILAYEDSAVNIHNVKFSSNASDNGVANEYEAIIHTMGPNPAQLAAGAGEGVVHIYGGSYEYGNDANNGRCGGFNILPADSRVGGKIVIHEGTLLSQEKYTAVESTGSITLEEGCELVETVIDGETWYKVTKQ